VQFPPPFFFIETFSVAENPPHREAGFGLRGVLSLDVPTQVCQLAWPCGNLAEWAFTSPERERASVVVVPLWQVRMIAGEAEIALPRESGLTPIPGDTHV